MKPGIACICLAIWVTSLMLATAATSSAQIFGYITDNMDRTVSVIDTTSDTVVATIDVGIPYPYGVACHPDGKTVYVSGTGVANAGTVFLIDVATQTLADSVAVGATARGLAVLPDGSAVYVANNGDDTVSVIDTNTFSVVGTIPVGVGPHGVVAHPDGSTVYVSNIGTRRLAAPRHHHRSRGGLRLRRQLHGGLGLGDRYRHQHRGRHDHCRRSGS